MHIKSKLKTGSATTLHPSQAPCPFPHRNRPQCLLSLLIRAPTLPAPSHHPRLSSGPWPAHCLQQFCVTALQALSAARHNGALSAALALSALTSMAGLSCFSRFIPLPEQYPFSLLKNKHYLFSAPKDDSGVVTQASTAWSSAFPVPPPQGSWGWCISPKQH